MILRRPLQIRNFDTDPGWLGPKYLNDYYAEPDAHRRINWLVRPATADLYLLGCETPLLSIKGTATSKYVNH